jgi:glycosyltransferase involved in cell wall biosynthesis
MRLVIWHTDRFPTAPGVYLGCFPGLGHEITWVVSEAGERNEVLERRDGGVRHFEIRLRPDSRLPRPLGTLINRWNKLSGFFLKARLMERLARERPDVLQVRDLVTEGLLALGAARRHGVRFAYQLDHPHFEGRLVDLELGDRGLAFERLVLRVWIRLRRVILRGADLVFPISVAMGEILRDREGVDPRRMVPFPVGVSRSTFDRGGSCVADPRVTGPADSPTVCYLGNLEIRRDPGLIFRTFEEVARRLPESRFLVVARLTDAVRERLRGLSVAERIQFIPFVPYDEVPALLRAARVGLYAIPVDDRYGVNVSCSPLKVVEYMNVGLPVVSSRVRDAEDALAQSGGGVCVESEPVALAAAVETYLRDPERARCDGARGRAWVETHRLFDVLAREVEAAYRRLLEGGEPAPADSPLLATGPEWDSAASPRPERSAPPAAAATTERASPCR